MNETAIRRFHTEVLAQYPGQCQRSGACGMLAKRAIELSGSVAAGLEEPEAALALAREDAAKYYACKGQNVRAQEDYFMPPCGGGTNDCH